MLREAVYRQRRRRFRFGFNSKLLRGILLSLLGVLFLFVFVYSVQNGSSRYLIRLLSDQRFPFEAVILEGAAGLSKPQRETLDNMRSQGMSLGMFLLTGVNISDTRTYFLSYFAPPSNGPAWLGWAYYPDDPEREGLSLEQLPENEPEIQNPNSVTPPISKEVKVAIYHTHNSESYAGAGGPERETGENGDIVTAGETLKKSLEKYGVKAFHSTKIHDAVDFMKAYSVSIATASQMLRDYPSTELLLDIHRDGKPPGTSKSTIIVKGKEIGRVLIVIGKMNDHWKKNEAVAKELIEIGEQKFPGLFIPNISYAADARYNQHLSDGALLMEFGSQLNTLEEVQGTADAVAEVIAEWFKTRS
ncbi:MAG: stage II sporulation protein P [Desulfitobacterium hafniense]|nr:stage II sporulation protein P [Desulfitobacterium hafniense]